jgi:signal transduction histidine kinase
VDDDGVGLEGATSLAALEGNGKRGLGGMNDRVTALGGRLILERAPQGGTRVHVVLPERARA